jgi:hypothetical protein
LALYIKKVKKQALLRFILTNLFTTLQCQRKRILNKSISVLTAFFYRAWAFFGGKRRKLKSNKNVAKATLNSRRRLDKTRFKGKSFL